MIRELRSNFRFGSLFKLFQVWSGGLALILVFFALGLDESFYDHSVRAEQGEIVKDEQIWHYQNMVMWTGPSGKSITVLSGNYLREASKPETRTIDVAVEIQNEQGCTHRILMLMLDQRVWNRVPERPAITNAKIHLEGTPRNQVIFDFKNCSREYSAYRFKRIVRVNVNETNQQSIDERKRSIAGGPFEEVWIYDSNGARVLH